MLEDLRAADFGDVRLTKRLARIAERLAPDPGASFPEAAETESELEATYRFLGNEQVTPQRILAPHVARTVERAMAAQRVVVAHDTTEFAFSTEREGLGRINDGGRGFFAHYALAMDVSLDGKRRPLGVLGIQPLTRIGPVRGSHHSERIPEEERESFRWNQLVQRVGELLRDRVSTVHVMDSEADSYALFWRMVERGDRFVVRLHHNRSVTNVAGNTTKLDTDLPTLQGWFTREVALAARGSAHRANQGRKRNLARHTRLVRLEFAAIPVTFHRPETVRQGPLELRMHVVHVREVQPPDGEEPVDWKLVTTEPIDCVADIEAIVDMYRARWLIEEFFKALKTGCAFEKRQLESLSALLNALAVLTPIACSLLLLRNLSREEPDSSAEQVLSPLQLLILQRRKSTALPPNASVRQAMLAIARLGGHIKANGDPGWLVLGRGYQKLLDLAEGARIALNM